MGINYSCQCGVECPEDELIVECTFYRTLEEPAEYETFCPGCNTNAENMQEVIDDE